MATASRDGRRPALDLPAVSAKQQAGRGRDHHVIFPRVGLVR